MDPKYTQKILKLMRKIQITQKIFKKKVEMINKYGHLTSLAPHERLPELPVIPREKPHTGATAQENPEVAPSS